MAFIRVPGQGNFDAKEITYAEWLALSEEEQNNGAYFITDGEPTPAGPITAEQVKYGSSNVDAELDTINSNLSNLRSESVWTKIGTTSGQGNIDLSSYNFKELLVIAGYNGKFYSIDVMKEVLSTSVNNNLYSGFGWGTEKNIMHVDISTDLKAYVEELYFSNTNYVTSCIAYWYIK